MSTRRSPSCHRCRRPPRAEPTFPACFPSGASGRHGFLLSEHRQPMKKSLLCSTLALAVASAAQAAPKTVDIMVLYTPRRPRPQMAATSMRGSPATSSSPTPPTRRAASTCACVWCKQRLDWADYPTVTGTNLDRFMRDPQVQRLREQYGADLVSLVNRSQNSGNGYITCGIGYMGSGDKNSGASTATPGHCLQPHRGRLRAQHLRP